MSLEAAYLQVLADVVVVLLLGLLVAVVVLLFEVQVAAVLRGAWLQ